MVIAKTASRNVPFKAEFYAEFGASIVEEFSEDLGRNTDLYVFKSVDVRPHLSRQHTLSQLEAMKKKEYSYS